MRTRALACGIVAATAVVLLTAPVIRARDPGTQPLTYHTGASLVCSACHTMHYSEGGQLPASADPGGPFRSLLLRRSTTDLCLNCHGTGGTAPNVVSGNWPGGTFPRTGSDEGRGHNPFGQPAFPSTQIPEDSVLHLSPPGSLGGTLTEFTCGTCHDSHGSSNYITGNANVFSYRLLRKSIRGPGGITVDVSATILSTFADEQFAEVESATNHNVYRAPLSISDTTRGFTTWCSACHALSHRSVGLQHPLQEMGDAYTTYTQANLSEGYVGGTYHYRYPLETNRGAGATTGVQWPITSGNSERVFCMTCHRAHGSANLNAGRWDFTAPSGTLTGCTRCHSR